MGGAGNAQSRDHEHPPQHWRDAPPIDGKDYIVISYADCGEFDSVYVYVDPTTFLPHLFAYVKPNIKIQAIHSDYREIDGMKVPFSIQMDFDGKKFIALSVVEWKINTGLSDSLFDPESLKHMKGVRPKIDLAGSFVNAKELTLLHKVTPSLSGSGKTRTNFWRSHSQNYN